LFASAHSQKRTQSSVGHSEQDPSYLNTVTSLPPWEPGQVTNKFRQIPLSDHPHAWTLQPRRALFSQGSAAPSKQAYEARGRGGVSLARPGGKSSLAIGTTASTRAKRCEVRSSDERWSDDV